MRKDPGRAEGRTAERQRPLFESGAFAEIWRNLEIDWDLGEENTRGAAATSGDSRPSELNAPGAMNIYRVGLRRRAATN